MVDVAALRRDDAPVREQIAGIIEADDAVAQQAPALLRVTRDDVRGVAVGRVCGRAGWAVRAHRRVFQFERSAVPVGADVTSVGT